MRVRGTFLNTAICLSPPLIVPLSSPFPRSQPSSSSTFPHSAEHAFTISTQLSRWRFCRRASRSRSARSDPRRSRASRCCPSGPAAPWPQCGSLGPSPATGFSADRHIGLGHLPRRDSPPISEEGRGSGGRGDPSSQTLLRLAQRHIKIVSKMIYFCT